MSRFEIVRADAGWHARFRARNGQIVWLTEVYARRRAALRAIEAVVDVFGGSWVGPWWDERLGKRVDAVIYRRNSWEKTDGRRVEIRDIDEREVKP